MAKIPYATIEQYRRDGMAYAYKILTEAEARQKGSGVKALESELRLRNIFRHPIGLDMKYVNEWVADCKQMLLATVKLASVLTLRDEFGFGEQRCKRYNDRFTDKAECILLDFATWEDFIECVKEELNIDISLVRADTDTMVATRVVGGLK